jgi:hypothetical protein
MDELLEEMADPIPSGMESVVLCRGSTSGPRSTSREADLLWSPGSVDAMMTALPLPLSMPADELFVPGGRTSPKLRARALSLKLLVLDLEPK